MVPNQVDMLPMKNASGEKFALLFDPGHHQHGWIFYDNHGQWVTLRPALPNEIERAKQIIETREVLYSLNSHRNDGNTE